jgi:hypothetical protein
MGGAFLIEQTNSRSKQMSIEHCDDPYYGDLLAAHRADVPTKEIDELIVGQVFELQRAWRDGWRALSALAALLREKGRRVDDDKLARLGLDKYEHLAKCLDELVARDDWRPDERDIRRMIEGEVVDNIEERSGVLDLMLHHHSDHN